MLSAETKSSKKKVLVALSGGVDSAVSASLLLKDGYEVEGAHMVCWNEGPYCRSDQDRADAAKVASFLNIPFKVFDFRQEYKEEVINYFYSEYEAGRTPNPDIACNSEIKFGIFLRKALEAGYDYIATGHYARVQMSDVSSQQTDVRRLKSENLQPKTYNLLAGVDPDKDQSYFLYRLTQKELASVLFPIGHLKKTEVRLVAASLGLPNAHKKDSQGICFIGDVDVREFLSQKIVNQPGEVVTTDGVVVGKHRGLAFYTIGQREGVGASGTIPYYIVRKERATNTVVVAPLGHASHFQKTLLAGSLSWVKDAPKAGTALSVRIRYRQPLVSALVQEINVEKLVLEFDQEQRAVTPGQAVVIYKNDEVLGGGTISETEVAFSPKATNIDAEVYS